MSKRAQRKSAQQQLVRTSTAELLCKSTPDEIKMTDIARSMGASVGGLYRYYPSKESIFAALQLEAIDALFESMQQQIERQIEADGRPSWPLIEVIFDSWQTFETSSPALARTLNRFAWRPDPILTRQDQDKVGERVFQVIGLIEHTLNSLANGSVISGGDQRLRAYTLWGMVFGYLQLRQRQRSGMSAIPLAEIRMGYLKDIRNSWATQ